jgi:2-oxoglutarate/2-oxoacid ferredoxin oxidoreductase subunit beta
LLSEMTEKYYRTDNLPAIWCPGCTNGVVTSSIVRAIDRLSIPKDDIVIVSGIGCSSTLYTLPTDARSPLPLE